MMDVLQKFIARATLLIYPHHELALASIREMGLSSNVVEDLESWMMSETYTKFREARQIYNRVPIPKTLIQGFLTI